MNDQAKPKSQFTALESLVLAQAAAEEPIHTTSVMFCPSQESYRKACRQLIAEHEINWVANELGIVSTDIETKHRIYDGKHTYTLRIAYQWRSDEGTLDAVQYAMAVVTGEIPKTTEMKRPPSILAGA